MACTGFGTPPPNEPECRSVSGPRNVISAAVSPRIPVHRDGTSAAHIVVSETTITSQASRPARAASNWAKCGEPDSSSPSISSLMVTGGALAPEAARHARSPSACSSTWPLSSEAPRPSSTSPIWAGSNGGKSHSLSGPPVLPSAHAELTGLAAEVDGQLSALRVYVRLPADPEPLLEELAADRETAWKLPRLYELGTGFDESGLGALLDELARRQATPDLAAAAFDQAWYTTILDRIRVADPRYAAHRGGALDEIASDFRVRDVQHLSANRARVRRAWAQQL